MNERDKQLKRAWRSEQRARARAAFPIPAEELAMLFAELAGRACDHTRTFTEAWLVEHGHDVTRTCAWLDEHHGFCDCGAAQNVRQHVDDALASD